MSLEIMYVRTYVHTYVRTYDHVRPPDCACTKVVGILLSLLVFLNQLVWQLLVPGAGYVPNTAATVRRDCNDAANWTAKSVLEKRLARETPDERNGRISAKRGYEMAMTALPIQPLPVCVALLKSRL